MHPQKVYGPLAVLSCNAESWIGVLRSFQTAHAIFMILAPLIASIASIQHRVCQEITYPKDSLQLIENISFLLNRPGAAS
jgi:hypothetical protein